MLSPQSAAGADRAAGSGHRDSSGSAAATGRRRTSAGRRLPVDSIRSRPPACAVRAVSRPCERYCADSQVDWGSPGRCPGGAPRGPQVAQRSGRGWRARLGSGVPARAPPGTWPAGTPSPRQLSDRQDRPVSAARRGTGWGSAAVPGSALRGHRSRAGALSRWRAQPVPPSRRRSASARRGPADGVGARPRVDRGCPGRPPRAVGRPGCPAAARRPGRSRPRTRRRRPRTRTCGRARRGRAPTSWIRKPRSPKETAATGSHRVPPRAVAELPAPGFASEGPDVRYVAPNSPPRQPTPPGPKGNRPRPSSSPPGPREPLQPGQEALGGRRRGRLGEDALQPALGVGLRLALGAGGQMRQDALTRVMTELSVHQGGESVSQMLLGGGRTG